MKLGVKFSYNNWREILGKTKAKYAEVWFRVEWENRYRDIFNHLNKNRIKFGLHFWSEIEGGFLPNLAYKEKGISEKTAEAIKKNIDIAEKVGAVYVNIHPGALTLEKVNLDEMYARVIPNTEIKLKDGIETFRNNAVKLNNYAKDRNVLFLVETVPKNEAIKWNDKTSRLSVQRSQNLPPEALLEAIDVGIYISNDIGHLISAWVSDDGDFLFKKMMDFSKKTKNYTKLIHLNTVIPPFNGTDSHNGILPADFSQNVIPNKKQLIEFFSLFENRDDAWVISEPKVELMVENYFEVRRLFM